MQPRNPTLAATAPAFDQIAYPIGAQPKIDGVCALGGGDFLYSRRIKPFPNRAVQALYAQALADGYKLSGLHGEVITSTDGVFSPCVDKDAAGMTLCNRTSGILMTHDGQADIQWWVFDVQGSLDTCYRDRHATLVRMKNEGLFPDWIEIVPLTIVEDRFHLSRLEQRWARLGYEGAVLKKLGVPYRYGRASVRSGELMRVTAWATDEAVITDAHEEMANDNEATIGSDGHTERSSAKQGLRPNNTLGALSLRGIGTKEDSRWVDADFRCGTGWDDVEAARLWALHQEGKLVGQIVTYRHKPHGAKDAPRFPAYKGIRPSIDL